MDDVTIARALHVVSVVLWIGGVAFVTTVLLPTVRRLKARQEQMQLFNQIEQRFAWQARVSTAIVGLTGFYMLYRFDMWDRFRHAAYWWIDAMVAVWLLFTDAFCCRTVRTTPMVACAIQIKTGSNLQGCRMAASNPTVHQFGHRLGGGHG
jgi:uncharacterized membrane protein